MVVNSDVLIRYVFQQISIATDIMIVRMRAMKPTVLQLLVPTISFCVLEVVWEVSRSALRKLNYATENETVKMEQTKKLLAVSFSQPYF